MTAELRLELKMKRPVIELDEIEHVYRVDGRIVRSWSQIAREAGLLEDLSHVPAHHLENAKARGSQVDDACSLLMEGRYTWSHAALVAPEAQPYIAAYNEYWDSQPRANGLLYVQTPLYCRELDFCCTPDWHDGQSVNDIKATAKVSRTWGLQTAAQSLAHGTNSVRRIIWLRPKMKTRQYEVLLSGGYYDTAADRRVFSEYDFDVVKAACRGDYDADCIKRWRAGE